MHFFGSFLLITPPFSSIFVVKEFRMEKEIVLKMQTASKYAQLSLK